MERSECNIVATAIVEGMPESVDFIVRCELCGNVHHVRPGTTIDSAEQWNDAVESITQHLRESHGIGVVHLAFELPTPETANVARFWIPY